MKSILPLSLFVLLLTSAALGQTFVTMFAHGQAGWALPNPQDKCQTWYNCQQISFPVGSGSVGQEKPFKNKKPWGNGDGIQVQTVKTPVGPVSYLHMEGHNWPYFVDSGIVFEGYFVDRDKGPTAITITKHPLDYGSRDSFVFQMDGEVIGELWVGGEYQGAYLARFSEETWPERSSCVPDSGHLTLIITTLN